MKLCAVQARPVLGDIERNIADHARLARQAAELGAALVLFPELSLTGYQPALAAQLASDAGDPRLEALQRVSDATGAALAVGLPLHEPGGVAIGMVILRPGASRLRYAKQFLHHSEEPWFVPGHGVATVVVDGTVVAPAICYELSVPRHAEAAAAAGAAVYAASVAKTATDARRAADTLVATARRHGMLAVMANAVGRCDEQPCGGATAAWGRDGRLLGALSDSDEGLLVLDTDSATASTLPGPEPGGRLAGRQQDAPDPPGGVA